VRGTLAFFASVRTVRDNRFRFVDVAVAALEFSLEPHLELREIDETPPVNSQRPAVCGLRSKPTSKWTASSRTLLVMIVGSK